MALQLQSDNIFFSHSEVDLFTMNAGPDDEHNSDSFTFIQKKILLHTCASVKAK